MPLTVERTSPTTLTLTRHFAAPPARVWDAHMRPELIRRWMCGEGGTTMPVCTCDARVGGRFHYEWREPDASGFSATGTFEVVEPQRRTVHIEVMHLPDPTPENRVETRFDPDGKGGTILTMTMALPDSASMDMMIASGMSDGLEGCYRQLDALSASQPAWRPFRRSIAMNLTLDLQGDQKVIVTRHFAAAPARVWAAHTDPALMQRWLTGPDGWVMTHCHCDARPGGTMRCDWAPEGGGPGAFHLTAEFLEVEPTRRMVHVERMFLPDATPNNHVETLFEAVGTGTKLTLIMTLPDAATREAMLATGMAEGMEASYARFERQEAMAA